MDDLSEIENLKKAISETESRLDCFESLARFFDELDSETELNFAGERQ